MINEEYLRIAQKNREGYNKTALSYHSLFKDELSDFEHDRKLLDDFAGQISPGAKICDLGCGPSAHYCAYLLQYNFELHGVDISDSCIKNAREYQPDITFYRKDMMDTGFPEGHFDGLISFYSIFHIPKQFQADLFAEYYRILKPGGHFLAVTHKGDLVKTFKEIRGHSDLELYANFNTEDEIIRFLKTAGFSDFSVRAGKANYSFPDERLILTAKK